MLSLFLRNGHGRRLSSFCVIAVAWSMAQQWIAPTAAQETNDILTGEAVRQAIREEASFDWSTYSLDRYRLLAVLTGDMLEAKERTGWAEDALIKGFPGEAVKALQDGFDAGVLGAGPEAGRHQRLLNLARQRATVDRVSLPGMEREAEASPSGQGLVAMGEIWLGYGEPAKAAQLLEAGLAKGGVVNVNAAKLRLGEAQFHAGDAEAARKTWASVDGKDGSARLAQMWMLASVLVVQIR